LAYCKVPYEQGWTKKAPSAINGLSGLRFIPMEKANAIAECLENVFTPHELCDERHEEQVEVCVTALTL
jgi:hypothetical protein